MTTLLFVTFCKVDFGDYAPPSGRGPGSRDDIAFLENKHLAAGEPALAPPGSAVRGLINGPFAHVHYLF